MKSRQFDLLKPETETLKTIDTPRKINQSFDCLAHKSYSFKPKPPFRLKY